MSKPHETHTFLAEKRLWLDQLRKHHVVLVQRFLAAGGGAIFPVDLFMLGVANRSLYLLDGYLDAFDSWNVYVAGPLVRLQLDNLVRVNYLALVEKPHDLAMRLLGGEEFRHIRHKDGDKLSDRKLVELAAPMHGWLRPVYEAASGWVHLSPDHLFAGLRLADSSKPIMEVEFPVRPERVPARFLAEVQGAMTQATEELFGYIEFWEERKNNPLGMPAQSKTHDGPRIEPSSPK